MAKDTSQIPENIATYLQLLDTAMKKAKILRKELARLREWDPSMITKLFKGEVPAQIGDFRQAFAPYLIAQGGITEPAEVLQMAALLGYPLTPGDLADIVRLAKKYSQRPVEAARVEDFAKSVTLLQQNPPVPTPPETVAVDKPAEAQTDTADDRARQYLHALAQHIKNQCSVQPAACGHQFPIGVAIERTYTAGEPPATVSLDSLKQPRQLAGLLVGVPGSGRTVSLLRLAYAWASAWSSEQPTPLAVYVEAPAFLEYAGYRRNIFDFAAAQVYPTSPEEFSALREALQALDEAGEILWLVDQFDQLTDAQQGEVIAHLVSSPALYSTCPWQVPGLAARLRLPPTQTFRLQDLTPDQQRRMFGQWTAAQPDQDFDLPLGLFALNEVADLARLPLGVMAIYTQVKQHASSPTQIARQALTEYLTRAEMLRQPLSFQETWLDLPVAIRTLLLAGSLHLHGLAANGEPYALTRQQLDRATLPEWGNQWSHLLQTRLFEVREIETERGRVEALRFCNLDLAVYCAALNPDYPFLTEPHTTCPAHMTRQYQLFRDALYEEKRLALTK